MTETRIATPVVQGIVARVRREHGSIVALLDEVDRTGRCAKVERSDALAPFLRAVWDLFVAFEAHLMMEEQLVGPLLRAQGLLGRERANAMLVEHEDQRRRLLELLDDTESESSGIDALVAGALALVASFRIDIGLEEAALTQL